jgi:predicted nucleic acid-binding Zn ribbon protein
LAERRGRGSDDGSHKGRRNFQPGRPDRRGDRKVQKLDEVLSRLLQQRAYARPLEKAGLKDAWARAAGERVAERSRVAQFRNGILTIELASSTLRYELEAFQGPALLARLQQDPTVTGLTRITFRVADIDS